MKKFYGKQKISDDSNSKQFATIGFLKRHFVTKQEFEEAIPHYDPGQDENKVLKIVNGRPQWVKETND